MLETSDLDKKCKKGQPSNVDKEACILAFNGLKQHFPVVYQAKFFFSFFSVVFRRDSSRWTPQLLLLEAPQYSSMQFESVMTMTARMCLTFCAQTLVHTQPIKRLSHLETGLPLLCLLHSMVAETEAGLCGLQILLRKPKLAKPHDV